MRLAVLGATGSVGRQALDVAGKIGADVLALGARSASDALLRAAWTWRPRLVAVSEVPDRAFRDGLPPGSRLVSGAEGMLEAALVPGADTVLVAVTGTHGLRPTLAALGAGRRVALANKETLVAAGELVMAAAQPGSVLPVDSEHAALFHLLGGRGLEPGQKIWITASGGALRDWPEADLERARPQDVLRHPTWRMGAKITVDSATLMNKGLEVIEAHHLFRAPYDAIGVVIHPESVVHGMVEGADGSLRAELGPTDMALPIARALLWPKEAGPVAGALDLASLGQLTFRPVDEGRHPSLRLAYAVGRMGGIFPAVMSAANEEAVHFFLDGRIAYTTIHRLTEAAVERAGTLATGRGGPDLDAILGADVWARRHVRSAVEEGRCR